jgi:hypothetical protein
VIGQILNLVQSYVFKISASGIFDNSEEAPVKPTFGTSAADVAAKKEWGVENKEYQKKRGVYGSL